MHNFHNPYHFVPLCANTKKQHEKWRDAEPYRQRQDNPYIADGHSRYARGRLHGRIRCRLTTETPVFVGARRSKSTDMAPGRAEHYTLGREPAIPATTLRGMISSIAEAASCSAMRVLDGSRPMSYRERPHQARKKFGIAEKTQTGEWKIYELDLRECKRYKTSDIIQVDNKRMTLLDLTRNNLELFYYQDTNDGNKYYTRPGTGRKRGKFRVMNAKKRKFPSAWRHRDFFVPVPERGMTSYSLRQDVIDAFHSRTDEIGERNNKEGTNYDLLIPFHPLGTRRNDDHATHGNKLRLKNGDLVFFSSKNSHVADIAYSAIWRGSKGILADFIADNELLPFNSNRHHLSPAERVFGFVEERPRGSGGAEDQAAAYAGHVRFTEARLEGGQNDLWDKEVTLRILDTPKPPSPALYFRNTSDPSGYIAKKDLSPAKHEPQGRKFYLHHRKQDIENGYRYSGAVRQWWETRHDENSDYQNQKDRKKKGRLRQKTRIRPLRNGVSFTFDLEFDNLSDFELGMLLYSLSPNENFRHKIGMGKPLGLGTVRIDIRELQMDTPLKRYREEGPFSALTVQATDWRGYRNRFVHTMREISPEAIDAIELLGDPEKARYPVEYPQVQNAPNPEQENFKWWVNNDGRRSKRQYLKPLDESGSIIPWLERN